MVRASIEITARASETFPFGTSCLQLSFHLRRRIEVPSHRESLQTNFPTTRLARIWTWQWHFDQDYVTRYEERSEYELST